MNPNLLMILAMWHALGNAIDNNRVSETFDGDLEAYLRANPEFGQPEINRPYHPELTARTNTMPSPTSPGRLYAIVSWSSPRDADLEKIIQGRQLDALADFLGTVTRWFQFGISQNDWNVPKYGCVVEFNGVRLLVTMCYDRTHVASREIIDLEEAESRRGEPMPLPPGGGEQTWVGEHEG